MDPREYSVEERILDGRTITIRALHSDDLELWREVFEHLSPTSVYFRFFTQKKTFSEKEVKYYTELDFVSHVALLALVHEPDRQTPVAVARYVAPKQEVLHHQQAVNDGDRHRARMPQEKQAEVALAVDDEYQGLGIGSLLLKHLSIIARAAGFKTLQAFVMSENQKMLEVFSHSGLPMKSELREGTTWEIVLALGED